MAQSFTFAGNSAPSSLGDSNGGKVLVTGAAGRIGAYFAEHSKDKYDLRLMLRPHSDAAAIREFGEIVYADLTHLAPLQRACEGIDTVLHLAADPDPEATWDSLLPNNIAGTYNLFMAARSAGCRRVVYASSIHAVSGYPADYQVHTSDPVNPGDLYGVTKCFGEALARYFAEQEGLSAICVRIGAFQPIDAARDEGSIRMLDAFVSHRDLNQLLQLCIDEARLRFAVVHGLSDNRFKRLDLSDTRELLGYRPADDLTDEHPKLRELHLGDRVRAHSVADPEQKSAVRGVSAAQTEK